MTRTTIYAALCAAMAALAGGCASGKAAEQALAAYKAFQAQPRTYAAVRVRFAAGSPGEVTLKGVEEMLLEAPLNPLTAMQSSDNLPRIAEAVKNAILGATGIYTLGQVASMEPTVVTQPAPLIVQPEVIMVPEAGVAP